MTIIGATALATGTVGLVVNVGGTLYMVTGRPSAIETVAGRLTLYADVLARRPAPEYDDVLGDATMGVGGGGGQEFVTGPYNAIIALRDILLAKAA